MQAEFWPDTGPRLPGSEISETAEPTTSSPSTSSAEGSPVSRSVGPAVVWVRPTSDGSGRSSDESLASYDRESRSWRTFQNSLGGDSTRYSATFPRSGMTRSGRLYRLRPLVRRIYGRGSLLWPTPDASVVNAGESLENWQARRARVRLQHKNGNGFGMPLAIAGRLWPTATANDRKGAPYQKGKSGQRYATLVGACRMFPTPAARDPSSRGRPGQLPTELNGLPNPTFVEWLMGFPLGWTDLEGLGTP